MTVYLMFFYPILKSYGLRFAVISFILHYIPVVFMLMRLNVYSDENCHVKKTDDFGNEYWENTLGYNPIIYYLIGFSFFIIIAPYLDKYLTDVASSLVTSNLINLIISLAILIILLSPDLLDKILPFDLKTIKGTGQLIVLITVILLFYTFL